MMAVITRDVLCRNIENFSEMPSWRMLPVTVIMAAVCPGGRVSRTEIGCLKSACKYESLTAADMRMLAIRKPSYIQVRAYP